MARSNARISVPATITIAAIGVIAMIASGILRPSPVSGTPPTQAPVPHPPAAPATPAPSIDPDGEPDNVTTVDLDVASNHDIRVTVVDESGSIVAIRSGHAAEGMSVDWYDLKVE